MFLNSSNLASLRYFEVAARHLSFKRAALELRVTQGAVSQHIKQLEQALRCKLFYRLPRQITLTEEGLRLAEVVRRALGDIEREAHVITAERFPKAVRVRVGPSFALRWLVPRLANFYATHPTIQLFIIATHGVLDPVRPEFDLAIELVKSKVTGLHTETLLDEYLIPVCSPKYLTDHAFLKKPEDLTRCTLLHDAQAWTGARQDSEWRFWLRAAGAADIDVPKEQFFTLSNMSIEAALAHQGVAMGRASLVKELLSAGQLVTPLKHRIKSPTSYRLAFPKELAKRAEIQAVIEWLHEQADAPL